MIRSLKERRGKPAEAALDPAAAQFIVRHMTNYSEALDGTFRALGDPTRRAVIEALSRGPASVGALAQPFTMALPTFLQHLKVLEENGLITTRKTGRTRICALDAKPLTQANRWLEAQRDLWTKRLDQLDALVRQLETEEKERP